MAVGDFTIDSTTRGALGNAEMISGTWNLTPMPQRRLYCRTIISSASRLTTMKMMMTLLCHE